MEQATTNKRGKLRACVRESEKSFIAVRTNDNNVVMQNEQQFVYIASAKLMHVTFSLR